MNTIRLNNPFTSHHLVDNKVLIMALALVSIAAALTVSYAITVVPTAYGPLVSTAPVAKHTATTTQTVSQSKTLKVTTAQTVPQKALKVSTAQSAPLKVTTAQTPQKALKVTTADALPRIITAQQPDVAILLQPARNALQTSASSAQVSPNHIQLTRTNYQPAQIVLQ